MNDQNTPFISPTKRQPSNKGKFSGAKPPLRPKHVWSIRSNLQAEGRTRDLAMFNPAIDSKLRACDVVTLKVEDIAPNGYAADRAVDLVPVRGSPRPPLGEKSGSGQERTSSPIRPTSALP